MLPTLHSMSTGEDAAPIDFQLGTMARIDTKDQNVFGENVKVRVWGLRWLVNRFCRPGTYSAWCILTAGGRT